MRSREVCKVLEAPFSSIYGLDGRYNLKGNIKCPYTVPTKFRDDITLNELSSATYGRT